MEKLFQLTYVPKEGERRFRIIKVNSFNGILYGIDDMRRVRGCGRFLYIWPSKWKRERPIRRSTYVFEYGKIIVQEVKIWDYTEEE
jgi:hypothetical protein